MVVKSQDDEMFEDNKRVFSFTITDDDAVGSPAKDLTGLTIYYALSTQSNGKYSSTPFLVKSSPSSGIVVTDAVNGLLDVTLDTADTAGKGSPDGVIFHMQLEGEDGSGNRVMLATGNLTVLSNIANTV